MKKFFGILLICLGSILSLITFLASMPLVFQSFIRLISNNFTAFSFGEFLGALFAFLMLMGIAVFLILKGAKLIKRAKTKPTSITEEY